MEVHLCRTRTSPPDFDARRPNWTPAARKSRKGMSKRPKRSLDASVETGGECRQNRLKTGTPKRDDVGRAMLVRCCGFRKNVPPFERRGPCGAVRPDGSRRRSSTRTRPTG